MAIPLNTVKVGAARLGLRHQITAADFPLHRLGGISAPGTVVDKEISWRIGWARPVRSCVVHGLVKPEAHSGPAELKRQPTQQCLLSLCETNDWRRDPMKSDASSCAIRDPQLVLCLILFFVLPLHASCSAEGRNLVLLPPFEQGALGGGLGTLG